MSNVGGIADADDLFYNILVNNNNTGYDSSGNITNQDISIPLVFDETRTNPYINKANDYFMSVISFQLDTSDLPVFLCDVVPGATNINASIYYVTIINNAVYPAWVFLTAYTYNQPVSHLTINYRCIVPNSDILFTPANWQVVTAASDVYQQNILWVPEDLTVPFPSLPVPQDYNNYPYYYAYTYQHFISLINTALQTAYTNAGGFIGAPFLVLDTSTGYPIISLVANIYDFNGTIKGVSISPSTFKLFFNADLYYLFSSLTAIKQAEPYISSFGSNYGMNYQLLFVVSASGNNIKSVPTDLTTVPPSTFYKAIYNITEYSPLPAWDPVDTLIFTVAHLPVVAELISTPAYIPFNSPPSADTYLVLTDYSPNIQNGTEWKPSVNYVPLAEFRLVDLYGENEVKQLRIVVYWKDLFGTLHPFYLGPGGTALIKILFRKRSFYFDK